MNIFLILKTSPHLIMHRLLILQNNKVMTHPHEATLNIKNKFLKLNQDN